MKNAMKKIYLGLIILFLYLPIGVLIVASFNDSKLLGTWKGFTFKWYKQFFENKAIKYRTHRKVCPVRGYGITGTAS